MIDDDLSRSQLNVASDVWSFVRLAAGVLLALIFMAYGACEVVRDARSRAAADRAWSDGGARK